MLTSLITGSTLATTTADEVVEAVARAGASIPVLVAVFESDAGICGAMALMRWNSELEALEEVAITARRLGSSMGFLFGCQTGPLLDLLSQAWPVDLYPSRDQSPKEGLRFRVRRHDSASAQTSGQ